MALGEEQPTLLSQTLQSPPPADLVFSSRDNQEDTSKANGSPTPMVGQKTGVQERLSDSSSTSSATTANRGVTPIQAMRKADPSLANRSDKDITDRIKAFYPHLSAQQIEQYSTDPNGYQLLKEAARSRNDTPLAKAKAQSPVLANMSDSEAVHALYNRYARQGETLEAFTLRLNPPDSQTTVRSNLFENALAIAGETGRQLGPQSQIAGLTMWRGARELSVTGGANMVNQVLDTIYGQQNEGDRAQLISQYQAADPAQQKKLFADAVGQAGPALQQKRIDTARLFDQLQTGLLGLKDQKANQEAVDWMTKTIGQIDTDNPGRLPENQERIAKLIAQAPAQALVSLFPGVRELGIYSQLYDSNLAAIRAANPTMNPKEIDSRARAAADAQFPAQEVLAFMFKNGGGAITSSITNKILKAGADVVLTTGTGAATFASNQAIQNAAAGKRLEEGVPQAAIEGGIIGGVGAASVRVPELSVKLVRDYMTRSDAGKVVAGYMDSVANADPADINKFLRGDKDNAIDKATQARAKDVILSSLEKLGDKVPPPVADAIQQARGSSWEEAVSHVETAYSLLNKTQKGQVHDDVVATLKSLSETSTATAPTGKQPAPVSDSYLYPTEAPEVAAQRAEERRILTGRLTEPQYQEKAATRAQEFRAAQEEGQAAQRRAERGILAPDLTRQRGEAGFAINPADLLLAGLEKTFAIGMESTKRDLQTIKETVSKVTVAFHIPKTFYPEKKSEEAQAAASAIIQRRAQAGLFNNQFANEIYRQLQFQDEFKNGDKAYRRDQYVNKYPRAAQMEMLMKAEESRPTGDPIYDRMASVNRYIYGKLRELDEQEGIQYETRDNYVKHLLDPVSEKAFDEYVAKHIKFANPGYMKGREFDTYRAALATHDENGKPLFKMRTTSPERLLQVRIAEFSAARSKIQALRDLKQRGLAWDTKGENTPEEIKQSWANYKIHTADGKNYLVHPDAFQVINNAYNPSSIANTPGGSFVEFLKTMKGLSAPLRLGLSLAHEDHLSRIRLADRWTNIILRPGLPKAGDFLTALVDTSAQAIGVGGYPGMVRDAVKYGGIIHVLRGDREARNADEAWAVKQLTDAGFRANVSHEREMEFTQWLDERMPQLHQGLRKFGQLGEFTFKIASAQPLQRWMFSQVIPSVKAASLLEKIDNLYKARPELEKAENEAQRLVEVQKLGKQVDLRFGEMNYDNVFWTKAWKDVAIGSLLSASWQMGLIDYSVGAVKDLTTSAAHMDETIRTLREQGGHAALRKAVTDRALTSFFYTLTTMARGAVISYAFTGGVNSFMDYFFPKTGTNPDGSDKRLRQLDFAPELMAWWQHSHEQTGEFDPLTGTATMLRNKLSPFLNSIAESLTNTNYYGGQISEHGPLDAQGFLDRLGHFLENTFTPFTVESFKQAGGDLIKVPGQIAQGKEPTGTFDAILGFFGLNAAPHWTQRTPLENDIISEYGREHGHASDKHTSDLYQALHGYQQALASNDSEGILETYQTLKKLGMSDKSIAKAAQETQVPVAHKLFKGLRTEKQLELWRSMSPDNRKIYYYLLHKDAKQILLEGGSSGGTSQINSTNMTSKNMASNSQRGDGGTSQSWPRTETDKLILNEFTREHSSEKRKRITAKAKGYESLREAVIAEDSSKIRTAAQSLRSLGVSDAMITNLRSAIARDGLSTSSFFLSQLNPEAKNRILARSLETDQRAEPEQGQSSVGTQRLSSVAAQTV